MIAAHDRSATPPAGRGRQAGQTAAGKKKSERLPASFGELLPLPRPHRGLGASWPRSRLRGRGAPISLALPMAVRWMIDARLRTAFAFPVGFSTQLLLDASLQAGNRAARYSKRSAAIILSRRFGERAPSGDLRVKTFRKCDAAVRQALF